jgi:hypothetical protein
LCHLRRQAKTGGCGTKIWSSADGTVVERGCRNSGNHEASRSRIPAEILTTYLSNKCLRLAVKFTLFIKVAINDISKGVDG